MASVKSPEEQTDPPDEIKNATSPTEESAGSPTTLTADTTTAPMSKSQKKKAAAAAKKAAARANDNPPSQPTTTEEVDTVGNSEANANASIAKPHSGEPAASRAVDDVPASAPEQDLEGDAWGLNEGEPAVSGGDVTKPAADDALASGAQDSSSADNVQVASMEPKLEEGVSESNAVSNDDKTSESVPPPPTGEVSPDVLPNTSNELPNPDASDLLNTKIDPVTPSRAVAVDEHKPNEDTTEPNGRFNCEPMDLPPRPSDDDNTPLAQIAGRKKPSIDTNIVPDGLVNGGARKQTPSSAGENLGSPQFGSSSYTAGAGTFSNGPARPNAPSISPTSEVPARGPGAVGFGSAAPGQTPTTTSGFNFGFGSPQNSTPKNASGMSWGAPSPAVAPSKPAKSGGWGGWLGKARETFEQALGDEPSPDPAPAPGPTASSRAPPARSPSVERPAQSSTVGPTNSNSNSDAVPSPNRPARGMTSFEARMAALKQKAATGTNKDGSPGPKAEAETPKASSPVIPPSVSGISPISPSVSTQSHTQAQPSPLPLPTSMTTPTEQNAPQTPDQDMVTSAFSPPPRESTAETGKVGKLVVKFDNQKAPIDSKTASTGLRLQTQPATPDRRRSESPVTRRDSNASEIERPSLADMRSTSAPLPRTPINTASPRTSGSFGFGTGLGTTSRFNGGFAFGGRGLGGMRSGPGPSPMSTPVGEKNEAKFENHSDDDLSSVVEGSEPNDLDSQVGESDNQDLDSLVDEPEAVGLPEIPINIESPTIPTIPTAFKPNIPVTKLPGIKPFVTSPPPITAPTPTFEVTAPLPSPTRSELEPGVATPDDKTIADPSDLAEVVSELVPPKVEVSKDALQAQSPAVSEPALMPVEVEPVVALVTEEPAVPPAAEEPVTSPVVEKRVEELVMDEVAAPALHIEAFVSQSTETPIPEPLPVVLTEPTPEPIAEPVFEPTLEPATEPIVQPTPEPTLEPTLQVILEPASEAIPEAAPEPIVEATVAPVFKTPIEPTHEPVAEPVTEATETETEAEAAIETESPKSVVEFPVEPVSESAVEAASVASLLEPQMEAFSQPLPLSPIESLVAEPIPVVETEVPAEKPAAPKLSIDVPRSDDSPKPKSLSPPTPATPATPTTPAKKKKKKGKKGAAASEPVPTIPETISEPAPESEPASKSDPVSVSEPISWPISRPGPASFEVKPVWGNAQTGSLVPTPIESKASAVESIAEPAPTVEVLPAPEAPKEPEPEPTPEVVQDAPPKEEPVSPTEAKKQKKKKKRKSSAALATSPTDDAPPASEDIVEQSGTKTGPVMVEPVAAEPVSSEPTIVETAIAEPTVVEPTVVESTVVEPEVVEIVESGLVESEAVEPEMAEPPIVQHMVFELEAVESVVAELEDIAPEVVEPAVEVVPSMGVEELTKSEAIPDEGFETPKVVPQELSAPTESVAEPVVEPVEIESPSVIAGIHVEASITSPVEPAPQPVLASLPADSPPELIPVFATQLEPEVEPIVALAVEPTVEPMIETIPEPVIETVAEHPAQPASEQVPELFSEPTVEVTLEPTITSPVEEAIVKTIWPLAEPTLSPAPELEAEPPTEPTVELVTLPDIQAPKEEQSVPEVKETCSPSKSSKKKNKRKGVAKATAVAEELALIPATDEPVVEVVRSEVPPANMAENKVGEEIATVSSPTTPKKKGKKAKAVASVPTPVEEKAPALPLPSEVPATTVDRPRLEEMEEALVTVAPSIEPFESLVQTEEAPKIEVIELSSDQTEATPKIEVIELADDQYAEAASTISVVQPPYDDAAPSQLTPSAVEFDLTEPVPDVLSEPEPVPVLVDLPQPPTTSVPSVVSSSPRSIIPSPRPPSVVSVVREISTPPRSVTPSTTKHDETHEAPLMPVISAPSPVRPILEHIDPTEAIVPLSPSPVSERASESSRDLGSLGREASTVPQESRTPQRSGPASSITSMDTDSSSTAEKAKMRPSMPPLISIPILPPVPTTSPYPNSAVKQPLAQAELECKPNAAIIENPTPIIISNDLPTNDVPTKPDVTAKPSSSRILDGFSPLRWFGFGGSSSPSVEVKAMEVNPVEVPPVEVNRMETKPVEVARAKDKLVTVKPAEIEPIEIKPTVTAVRPFEIVAVDAKPVVKPVETPVVVSSSNPKPPVDRERQPKVTLVPIRKAASPTSPESPAMEKTAWSRWPYQPTMITSIPPVKSRVPLARDSVAMPTRPDGQITPPRPSRAPAASIMPPIIPVAPTGAVQPSAYTMVDPPRSRRPPRTDGATLPISHVPVHTRSTSTKEKSESPAKRLSDTARIVSPTPNIPSVAFQSPRSSEDSLPAYTPQAPNVDREPKPAPRGILKQRTTPVTPPTTDTPTANPTRAPPQVSKFELTGSRHVPAYHDWDHVQSVRMSALSNTSAPRSREAPAPTTTTPPSSRNRTMGDSKHRSRSKHSAKELGSVTNMANRPRTPSPSRETKATSKTTTPPKANLVPVLNDKVIRTKVPRPAKISTTRTTGDVYIQPLTSPILLTSENYGARLPENSVYQYDGISPSESLSPATRKTIFDILHKQVAPQIFPVLARPSFDGKKMLYANRRLNVSSRQEFSVELPEPGQEPQVYIVQLKKIAVITPQIAPAFR
ncbi:unnamed protein product [Rhizoctonia solani]|uniref:Protein argonaute N-terminal domain-containing protein n=1 Tax=Rhizoctonia solani TaxID=456999 RepID=A0A8H3AYA6_9AGAM|nr:unnamed protein product [Rhizoctonia solani]